jgi:hypothetical protein
MAWGLDIDVEVGSGCGARYAQTDPRKDERAGGT